MGEEQRLQFRRWDLEPFVLDELLEPIDDVEVIEGNAVEYVWRYRLVG